MQQRVSRVSQSLIPSPIPTETWIYTNFLGLARGATLVEIKRSYRRLARKYHPDINPGDNAAEAHFKEITPCVRDAERSRAAAAVRRGRDVGRVDLGVVRVRGVRFFRRQSRAREHDVRRSVRRSLHASGRTCRRPSRVAAQILHASVSLTFDEALRGAERQMTLTRRDTCQSCRGAGVAEDRRGAMPSAVRAPASSARAAAAWCFRRAVTRAADRAGWCRRACGRCAGLGVEMRSETISVRIPGRRAGRCAHPRAREGQRGRAPRRHVGDLLHRGPGGAARDVSARR